MKFLWVFAHVLHQFRIPEVQAIADMYGYQISYDKEEAKWIETNNPAEVKQVCIWMWVCVGVCGCVGA
jgi:tRNA G10  N-methylase Trm11